MALKGIESLSVLFIPFKDDIFMSKFIKTKGDFREVFNELSIVGA